MKRLVEDTGSDLSEHPVETLRRINLEDGDERIIVEPATDELFIDIDSEDDFELLDNRLQTLRLNGVGVDTIRTTPSRRSGHYHVVLRLDRNIDPTMRVALQACLGSDRKREILSALRILFDMDRPPTVFFEEADLGSE